MTAEPLDPAAVKAEHRRDTYGQCASLTCEDERGPSIWPCLPYRLAELAEQHAAELAGERERVRRVQVVRGLIGWALRQFAPTPDPERKP